MASIVVSGDTSGAVTITAPAIAGTTTLTLPTTSGTLVVTGGAQTIEFADGTVSAPSITNSGDTNTGIYFPAADTIAFTEGGVESMRIDSSGNLLVGGTSQSGTANRVAVFSGNKFGLSIIDTTAQAAGVGGALNLGGNYRTAGDAQAFARIAAAKENSTDNNFAYAMAFSTTPNGGTFTERMRIDSSGNVGIGTSSPTAPLTIVNSALGEVFRLTSSSANIYGLASDGTISCYTGGVLTGIGGFVGTSSNHPYIFRTNNTERMRITSGGAVCIGGTSARASASLDILGNIMTLGENSLYYATIDYNAGAGFLTLAAESGGGIKFNAGATERGRFNAAGYFKASNDATAYIAATGSYHEFIQTANSNGIYFRASNASYTGIINYIIADRNTTNSSFYPLAYYNNGASAFRLLVADSGNITNTNGSYGTISDVKNKENIVDATPKLEKINQLQVRNFNFKGDELKQIGFVAQEFEQVFPSMVEEHHDKDVDGNDLGTTTKSIKTSVLVPILVKAIQELNAKVEAQAAEIQALKGAR